LFVFCFLFFVCFFFASHFPFPPSVTKVYARRISGRYDIGNLDDYVSTLESLKKLIVTRANARVGLVGNPSDGFNGKTISYSLANYWAQVRIWETRYIDLLPNEVFDTTRFSSTAELATKTQITGYYGGIRLLRATCKRFYELTKASNHTLTKNFTLCYNSNIPFGTHSSGPFLRFIIDGLVILSHVAAVGLAGSSAIVTATFRALMAFFGLSLGDINLTQSKVQAAIAFFFWAK